MPPRQEFYLGPELGSWHQIVLNFTIYASVSEILTRLAVPMVRTRNRTLIKKTISDVEKHLTIQHNIEAKIDLFKETRHKFLAKINDPKNYTFTIRILEFLPVIPYTYV